MADKPIVGFTKDELTEMVRQILAEIPASLPANGGNADTVGGKSASDFVEALTTAQTISTRILIPNDVDVADWLMQNAKIGTVYYRTQYSTGQTNLPPIPDIAWAWFTFDGIRYLCKVMINDYSTRDFLLDNVNLIKGWKEISTTPIKSETFSITTDAWSHIRLFSASDNKEPISVIFTNKAQMCSIFIFDGYYYLDLYDFSGNPIPNTAITYTLYWVEG